METADDIIRALKSQKNQLDQLAKLTNDLAQLVTRLQEQQHTSTVQIGKLADAIISVQSALPQQPPTQ